MSWGSAHWSYLEDISKVTPHEGTPLKLEKRLYNYESGPTGNGPSGMVIANATGNRSSQTIQRYWRSPGP